MRRIIINSIIFIILSISLIAENNDIDKVIEFQAQKFKYILETAYQFHPDSLDIIKISDAAFEALLQAVDSESFYYNKQMHKRVQENHKGVTYGIGVEIVNLKDTLFVIRVVPNSPAEEKGIEVGSVISAINGKKAFGISKFDADEMLQGDSATFVDISIIDVYSKKEKKEKILRRDIPQPGLTTAYLFPNTIVGIFVINRFTETIADEFKKSAEDLLKAGMKRMVIDVRGNPGGYMTKVDEMLDMLIGGEKILTKAVSGSPDFAGEIYSKDGDFLEDMPVVILIDENSASGSELLAGVIQDYDRGLVVGKRSYGKGTIQRIWSMNDTTGFKLTVGKYVTPSGREIQKKPNNQNIKIDYGLNNSHDYDLLSKKIEEMGGFDSIEILKSEGGRSIISGGGVFPDNMIDKDTLTALTQLLIQRGLYFRWAVLYKQKEGKNLLEKYGNDFRKYNAEFNITDELLREFANFAHENNVWNTDMYNIDKNYFLTYQKAIIANVLWGYDAFSEIMSVVDNQLVAAILETPKAASMISK